MSLIPRGKENITHWTHDGITGVKDGCVQRRMNE